ncbi:putative minor capsid protein [Lacticaseibacillus absianus]|uniref:putative minor capsid protein n=1 Tax=Lacticaseibacillus absianus TaxID=2729623 RepID=UPI0015C842AA|nr:putative minor capsid protein [Lacticaseibacillus absianus]
MAKDVDPIPIDALVDSIDVVEHHSSTAFEDQGDPAKHHFERVLVQPVTKKQVTGGSGEAAFMQHLGNTVVFIDALNSVNADSYSIKLGDTVNYPGGSGQVVQIDALKAWLPTPHHWEVWLA